MDAAMIGKIEKARQYVQEPDRIGFDAFQVTFQGDHHDHHVQYDQGQWACDCSFFNARGVCAHVMTLEKVLAGSVDHAQAMPVPDDYMDAAMIGKIEKAMAYAQQPDRIRFQSFQATFKGDHHSHNIAYHNSRWACDCTFAQTRGVCSHIMTIERKLAGSVDHAEARPTPA